MTSIRAFRTTALAAFMAYGPQAFALQDEPATAQNEQVRQGVVEIRVEPVRDNIHVIYGQGGNIGISIGEDGVFMIDDQFAPITERIVGAIETVSDQPIRFLINTHWHFDHTGGNENFGNHGAVIVAHENVRTLMSADQFLKAFDQAIPAAPEAALPVITFTDTITFHWNGDQIDVIHVPPAHTDGDSIIHFVTDNVIHAGDTYFNGMYPFIDAEHGGSIDGMVNAATRILRMSDEETRIIPGHGPVSGVRELREYRDMLRSVRATMTELIAAGKTREEAIAAKPTAEFDAEWGDGFMQPDQWVGIVFDSMQNTSDEGQGDTPRERRQRRPAAEERRGNNVDDAADDDHGGLVD